MKTLHIFRQGQQTDMHGNVINFTAADIAASAAAYDPKVSEAPIVVGHPAHNHPAYGWVGALTADSTGLHAQAVQVDASFNEMVEAGRFKKISASFYTPDSPSNPVKGVYYLRHVGFLGAMPPAVKGLKDVAFADVDCSDVVFAELDFASRAVPRLLRRLREWMIGKYSVEDADSALPVWEIDAMAEEALRVDVDDPTPAFSEVKPNTENHTDPKPKEQSIVTPEEKAQLEAENLALKADLASRDKAIVDAKIAATHNAHASFAESLVNDGKLVPAKKDAVIAVLDALDNGVDQPLNFGEGDKALPLVDVFKSLLPTDANAVLFGEVATKDQSPSAPSVVSFAAPQGYAVDSERQVLFARATEYAAQHKVDFTEAVKAVERTQ